MSIFSVKEACLNDRSKKNTNYSKNWDNSNLIQQPSKLNLNPSLRSTINHAPKTNSKIRIMTMNDCILFTQKIFESIFIITNELKNDSIDFVIDETVTLDDYLLKFTMGRYGLQSVALEHIERFIVSLDLYHSYSRLLTVTRSLLYSPDDYHKQFLHAQRKIFDAIRQKCLSSRLHYRSSGRVSSKEREFFVHLFTQIIFQSLKAT